MKRIIFPMGLAFFGLVLLVAAGDPAAEAQQPAGPQRLNTVLTAIAGPDRVVVLPAKTYLNGYVGYGDPPRRERRRNEPAVPPRPPPGRPRRPSGAWNPGREASFSPTRSRP